VLGDQVQLQQLVINLMLNGVKAMAPIKDRSRDILVESEHHEAG
jgi:C4-dicarboxylate-specific signal transduction histidine kinase